MLLSVSSTPLLIRGLVVRSQYAYIGRIRVMVLTLSYEVVLFPLIVGVLHVFFNVSIQSFLIGIGTIVRGIMWLCFVIEANRAPFDLAEGESELISGYHIEHRRIGFTLLFLAEYLAMVSFSFLVSALIFNSRVISVIVLLIS